MIKDAPEFSRWICDAAIDTVPFLEACLGEEIEADSLGDWDNSDEILEAIHSVAGEPYVQAVRDNCYNSENDFSDQFTFTVYVPERNEGGEWYYDSDAYIAVCIHLGGDVRGNYSGPRLFRADCVAETGFLDWVVGFTMETRDDAGDWDRDDSREGEECGVGYHSHPSSHVESEYGEGEWRGGAWYPKAHPEKRFFPYSYAGL